MDVLKSSLISLIYISCTARIFLIVVWVFLQSSCHFLRNLPQLWKSVVNVSHTTHLEGNFVWILIMVQWYSVTNIYNVHVSNIYKCFLFCRIGFSALNCRRYSPCKIEVSYLSKTTLSICVIVDKKTCFQLSCSCVDEPRGHNTLKTSDTSLKCMILKLDTTRMYDTSDEVESQNSLPCKNTKLKDDRPIQNATVDPIRQKRG